MKIKLEHIPISEVVEGYFDDAEKLDWFETINIAGEKLTEQEMRFLQVND